MSDSEILKQVQTLAFSGEYDKAIELTNLISNKQVAIKAHLLVIELEKSSK